QITAASHETQPNREVAEQVAMQITPHAAQPVLLVKNPLLRGGDFSPSPVVAPPPAERQAETTLDIQVATAALEGDGGVNPALALCVEAEARLIRLSDGAELYSCPVHYRSEQRKFTRWAAHDAQQFRQELQRCYREVSATIVNDLVARGFVSPEH